MTPRVRHLLIGGAILVSLAGLFQQTLRSVYGDRAAYIHVRWVAAVDEATRANLERVLRLTPVESRGDNTWAYYLADVSPGSIRRLVSHSAVMDTHYLDRQAFQLDPTAVRGPFISDRPAWMARALEFLFHACLLIGVAALGTAGFQALQLDAAFGFMLLAALMVRLYLGATAPYIHDEVNTHIPLSNTISFSPGDPRLPLRGENHGALPAYVVHASSALFGTTPLAYRALHLVIGLGAVLLVYLVAREWYGLSAARWAALLLAFNEYFLTLSSRATAHAPHLFLVAAAVYAFSRFLAAPRAAYLYVAGAMVGMAFYAKEHAALLLPVFFFTLLQPRHREWLKGPHPYLACVVFVALIAPDLAWNLRADRGETYVTYGGEQQIGQATYAAHLQRIGGIGFSPYPAMFYAQAPVMSLHRLVTGAELDNVTSEYRAVNAAIGVLLLAALVATLVSRTDRSGVRPFLLILAWGVFLFFSLIKRGNPPYRLEPVSWVWVEITLIPAVILAGARLSTLSSRWRYLAWIGAALAVLFALESVLWVPSE